MEKNNGVKTMSESLEERSLYAKQAMAKELKRLGLTEKAIQSIQITLIREDPNFLYCNFLINILPSKQLFITVFL